MEITRQEDTAEGGDTDMATMYTGRKSDDFPRMAMRKTDLQKCQDIRRIPM